MKPYYEQDGITIYHGDNREVLPALDVEVDLMFTSPPYNLGISPGGNGAGFYTPSRGGRQATKWSGFNGYGTHDDAMPMAEYEEWQRFILRIGWEMLSERGAIFYNHKPRIFFGEAWQPTCLNPGLPLRQIIIWDPCTPGVALGKHHWVPRAEWVMVFARDGFEITYSASAEGDLWRVPMDKRGGDHPAIFPEALPARPMRASPPGLALDPHMGSGTVLAAAKALNWRAIGIEIDERYCEVAAKRLSQRDLFAEVVA